MVVPVERLSSPEKIRHYTGNDLKLSIFNNKKIVIITGNNCKVKLNENSGLVKVIGDSCELTVLRGNGNIEYVGNKGIIKLGHDVSEEVVIYVGNEGVITPVNCASTDNEKLKKKKHGVTRNNNNKIRDNPTENRVNICNSSNVRCTGPILPSDLHIRIPSKISKHFAVERHVKL